MRRRRKRYSDAPYNGQARQLDGLTVFASDDHGNTRAFVRNTMPLRAALREVAIELDAREGRWLIDCISTPSTIYADLQGRAENRSSRLPVGEVKMFGAMGDPPAEPPYPPELHLLGDIGRKDLWRGKR